MSEEVIELTVDETNALRAKLGLKPLNVESKLANPPQKENNTEKTEGDEGEVLSLSVGETNDLRAKLGLAPLRTDNANEDSKSGRKPSEALHAPAPDVAATRDIKERIEEARVKRGLERNLRKMEEETGGTGGIGEDGAENALSWAEKMRRNIKGEENREDSVAKKDRKKAKRKKRRGEAKSYRTSIPDGEDEEENMNSGEYGAGDLEGLSVSHAESEFQEGQTTVLTLADAPLLEASGDGSGKPVALSRDEALLENVNLRDDGVSKDNLRKKREIEMGAGHAGGYAGYDDDEFAELGGSTLASYRNREEGKGRQNTNPGKVGFRIGEDVGDRPNGKQSEQSDLFASSEGRAISLFSDSGTATNIASDFLTVDEANEEEEKRKEQKRQKKLFKKKKKDKKIKDKSRHKRKNYGDDDDELENGENSREGGDNKSGSILDDLEATAVDNTQKIQLERNSRRRKRGRDIDDSDNEIDEKKMKSSADAGASGRGDINTVDRERSGSSVPNEEESESDQVSKVKRANDIDEEEDMLKKRRAKFDEIMHKGNVRTDAVFNVLSEPSSTKQQDTYVKPRESSMEAENQEERADDEEDDAFLNAALAKARRIRKLRELNTTVPATNATIKKDLTSSSKGGSSAKESKGADAIVRSLKIASLVASKDKHIAGSGGEGGHRAGNKGITFEFDETREFTRALRTKAEQADRPGRKRHTNTTITSATKQMNLETTISGSAVENDDKDKEDNESMEELAQQINEEDEADDAVGSGDVGGFGSTAATVPVGRGVSAVLNHLRHTGEITGKHAGKEELRGRAKDKRTYEDYESLNLKDVVKIDLNTAQEKDIEFANREVKLEYRDEFGRLLTRKEAYRNMCYQFHGHGSSKKNEERRLRQIARERAEGALASRQVGGSGESEGGKGTLGALKVAQRATGKAFVVHRT